ncbi:MAG: hypothetical protein EXR75_04675 [Myxococcales bacterium]|nr:hypothetical protein [Myxococcales bacterium]
MTTRRLNLGLAAALFAASLATAASAHIKLTSPAPRYVYTNSGQKTGPCGGGTVTGEVTALKAGQDLTVNWDETVNHPGHFRIALDLDGGNDFPDPVSEKDKDVKGNVIAYVADGGGSKFSHTFTVPDVACTKCSLQVLQVMTDKLPWGPANGNDLYFWCADVSIEVVDPTSGAGAMGGAGGNASQGGADGTGASGVGGSAAGAGGADTGTGGKAPSTGAGKTLTIGDGGDNSGCQLPRAGAGGGMSMATTLMLGALGMTLARRYGRAARNVASTVLVASAAMSPFAATSQ